MYKKAVDRRTTPQTITGETFTIVQKGSEYKALITEDPQENTPTTTFVCLKDMTARTGSTTTSILVNQAIDSTQASIWVGQKLGYNGEMRTISAITQGTAGNAGFTLSSGFSQAPTNGQDIYSPRKEQRDNNAVATNYFKVAMNDVGQPLPNLLFVASDNNKTGMVEEKGMGTTITALYEDQMQDMYDKTVSERKLTANSLTELNTNNPPTADLKGVSAIVYSNPPKQYTCITLDSGSTYIWNQDFAVPNNFAIASTNVQSGNLSDVGNATVTFTEEVAIGTVTSDNFKIKNGSAVEQASAITLSNDKKTVTINPDSTLSVGAYTLTVYRNVTDIYGRLLSASQDYIYNFNAVSDPAPTAPTITTTPSSSGAITARMTVASTDATPETVTYDYYMDDATIEGHTDLSEAQALLDRIIATGLDVAGSYDVKLVAKDSNGNSTDSNVVTTVIPLPAPPPITVTQGNTQNTITFAENSTLTGETYDIYFSTTETVAANIKASGTKITGVTSPHTHSSLTNGTQYNYVLVMNYGGLESSPSAVVSGTPNIGFDEQFTGTNGTGWNGSNWRTTYKSANASGSDGAFIQGNQGQFVCQSTSGGSLSIVTKTSVNQLVDFTSVQKTIEFEIPDKPNYSTGEDGFAIGICATVPTANYFPEQNWLRVAVVNDSSISGTHNGIIFNKKVNNASTSLYTEERTAAGLNKYRIVLTDANNVKLDRWNGSSWTTLSTITNANLQFTSGYIVAEYFNSTTTQKTFTIDNVKVY